ncbi:nitrate reductase cytochrome c-type subunit [Sphaerotilus microaerophilus]|uniref:Periplasmic nitrate reductase, electron transfer subunit n=1 Tax=Sphaerotilus microaerophilus TaxID=2914710 RepID=A0ABM7YSY3_9BURK|nr:nitrate reductase cytochrome c-type subunit [Sphaerotilus sp. FB-5]BDI07670.1 periplasmic nitrate reductase, electron transfer subunit [Sphaerotilus sp. FB-5]
MSKSLTLLMAAAVAAGVFGCAQFAGVNSLRGEDAATIDKAPAEQKLYAGKRPGSGAPIARTFKEQPPLVPHAIENFDEITNEENQCLECHSPANAPKKAAPKIGDSHLTVAAAVRMERYQCNSCHVPQVDAKPLVTNTFSGNVAAK